MKRGPLITSFILFIALCISLTVWVMALLKPPQRASTAPPQSSEPAVAMEAAAGIFGGRSTVAVASNYQLLGVIASGKGGESVAILATDGKPAQAVRANTEVMPGVTVKEVHARYVLLSEGGVTKRVELPQDAKSAARLDTSSASPVNIQQPQPPQQEAQQQPAQQETQPVVQAPAGGAPTPAENSAAPMGQPIPPQRMPHPNPAENRTGHPGAPPGSR